MLSKKTKKNLLGLQPVQEGLYVHVTIKVKYLYLILIIIWAKVIVIKGLTVPEMGKTATRNIFFIRVRWISDPMAKS